MSIVWTEDLATGIDEIDHQHQALYLTVDALHEAMKKGHLERVSDIVRCLESYAAEHFATEERYMVAHGYPKLEEHRAAHTGFVTEFLGHKQRLEGQGPRPLLVLELSRWLGVWLAEHLRKVDGEMGRYLHEVAGPLARGPGPSREALPHRSPQ